MFEYKSVAVYLGSSGRGRQIFSDIARDLGYEIARKGKSLVFGGMNTGLMGMVSNSALNPPDGIPPAHVTGVVPTDLRDIDHIHKGVDETIIVKTLCERKLDMFNRSDAVIAITGGFGTIDEIAEVLYWASIGSHNKPVVLLNSENYYDELISFFNGLPDFPKQHFIVANNVKEIFEKLDNWTAPDISGEAGHFPDFEDEILDGDANEPLIIKQASIKGLYFLSMALGLRQLGNHSRKIGIVNKDGAFDGFLKWIEKAQEEKYITDHCTDLFSFAPSEDELKKKMKNQPSEVKINLEVEKWGV